jgi:hypothetical protein
MRPADPSAAGRGSRQEQGRNRPAETNHAIDATRAVAGNRIASRGTA